MARTVNEQKLNLQHLLPPHHTKELVKLWLKEDLPAYDVGGFVVGDAEEKAVILGKSPGVLAGVPFVDEVFAQLNCTVDWLVGEGEQIDEVCIVAMIKGKARNILQGERVALNCLSRASGIATLTRKFVNLKEAAGWKGSVAGTRKTTPGFRFVEKYALLVGGAETHRFDLSSTVMIKDNHTWSTGSITDAIVKAKSVAGSYTKIEVECRSVEEAKEAAKAGCDIVMFDNFSHTAAHVSAQEIKQQYPNLTVEISGGITEENIADYFSPHIDVVSSGKLTHSYQVVDFSLKLVKVGKDPRNPIVTIQNGDD